MGYHLQLFFFFSRAALEISPQFRVSPSAMYRLEADTVYCHKLHLCWVVVGYPRYRRAFHIEM